MNFTSDDYYVLTETMSRYGGSFISKLADAIRAADSLNKKKILDAFPELIKSYGPDSRFANSMRAEKSNV